MFGWQNHLWHRSFCPSSWQHPQPAAVAWGRDGYSVPRSYRSGTKDTRRCGAGPLIQSVEQLPSKKRCLKYSLGHCTVVVSYSVATWKAHDPFSPFQKMNVRTQDTLCWAWWRICLAQSPATASKWMPRETQRGKANVCQYLPSMFSRFPAYHDQEVSRAVGSTFICHSPWWPFLVVAFSFSDLSSCFLNPCKLVAALAFS